MKQKINLDRYELTLLYRKYRQYIVPLCVIVICVLLGIFVLFPEFQSVLTDQQDNQVQVEKLQSMQANARLLQSLDEDSLNQQVHTVSAVLPPEKDFASILNAITISANKTGVVLNDFEFSVGGLTQTSSTAYPTISVDLRVNGDIHQIVGFVQQLLKVVPLASIKTLALDNGSAAVSINFYYKPTSTNAVASQQLRPLSAQELSFLQDLEKRQQNLQGGSFVPVASSTGVLTPSQ